MKTYQFVTFAVIGLLLVFAFASMGRRKCGCKKTVSTPVGDAVIQEGVAATA